MAFVVVVVVCLFVFSVLRIRLHGAHPCLGRGGGGGGWREAEGEAMFGS